VTAIFFKAACYKKFDMTLTTTGPFYAPDGGVATAHYMQETGKMQVRPRNNDFAGMKCRRGAGTDACLCAWCRL